MIVSPQMSRLSCAAIGGDARVNQQSGENDACHFLSSRAGNMEGIETFGPL